MTFNAERVETIDSPLRAEGKVAADAFFELASPSEISSALGRSGRLGGFSSATWSVAEQRLDGQSQTRMANSHAKRAFDIIVAVGALVVLLPLLLLVALLIRLESPGPAIFRQRRGGLSGGTFEILKFRTMRETAGNEEVEPMAHDRSRITRFGGFLRRSSIDELPQLINVLMGDMSIVGPRPHALYHDEYYARHVPGYMSRAAAKPGITGLAQVSGCRGHVLRHEEMVRRIAFDLNYIMYWSLMLDFWVIFATFRCMLSDPQAQ